MEGSGDTASCPLCLLPPEMGQQGKDGPTGAPCGYHFHYTGGKTEAGIFRSQLCFMLGDQGQISSLQWLATSHFHSLSPTSFISVSLARPSVIPQWLWAILCALRQLTCGLQSRFGYQLTHNERPYPYFTEKETEAQRVEGSCWIIWSCHSDLVKKWLHIGYFIWFNLIDYLGSDNWPFI